MQRPDHGIAILADLAVLGLTARIDGDRLLIGPRAKLTPELASRIRDHKVEVVEALRRCADGPADRPPPSAPFRHVLCAAVQSALRRRGFHVLADKPEVVLALVEAAEETAAKLGEEGGDE